MTVEKNNNKNILLESKIIKKSISDEMKSSYISYAMSVIIGRALPDVRDGLKSVHRRILYSMSESGITYDKPCKKSARIVGNVLGKYHPHGDSSVYDAIVRMVQQFSLRYPLIEGQGNFGSIDGDSAAAMRYTEVRLNKISNEMIQDIDKETVEFRNNYDGSLKEPVVLPSKIPNILINGSTGIAVGMATNMPPHNLSEVVDALIYVIDNYSSNINLDSIMNIIQGPDFPTGGIISNYEGLVKAYKTGRGIIKIRGLYNIEYFNNDKKRIVITELPYQVNKSRLIESIADCIHNKTIAGISDLRDESDRSGIRIVLDLVKGVNENIVINLLYKHTQFEISFGIINLVISNSIPKIMNLLDLLKNHIMYRMEIIKKRTEYDLMISKNKVNILNGLKIAISNIENIIDIIKSSDNNSQLISKLREQYKLNEEQIKTILDLKLMKLTNIESEKIENELKYHINKINEYNNILSSDSYKHKLIKNELLELKSKYSDSRRSIIEKNDKNICHSNNSVESFIQQEDVLITMTNNGYIKRIPVNTYIKQNRGGKGIIGVEVINHDFVKNMFVSSTHDYILFFTNNGKIYWKKTYEIPEYSRISKGKSIVNLLDLKNEETITAIFSISSFNDDSYLLLATKNGLIKRILVSEFSKPRKNGVIAIVLNNDDELISVKKTSGKDNFILATKLGKAICVNENEIRTSKRISKGVTGIKLHDFDYVVSMEIVNDKDTLLTITKNGFGKRTSYNEYIQKHRSTYGVKTIITNERNGPVISVLSVSGDDEIIMISSEGIIIRIDVKNIRCLKRNTQGVKLMSLNDGDFISGVVKTKNIN